jgi:hypothetical protein
MKRVGGDAGTRLLEEFKFSIFLWERDTDTRVKESSRMFYEVGV